MIYVFSLLMSTYAHAFDYDVSSFDCGDLVVYEITIDSCVTEFKVPKKKHEDFSGNDGAIKKMVEISIRRAENGCKDE